MIVFPAKVAAARAAAGLSRRAGAGGGTSLPGKLLLRMAPDAIPRLSRRLAGGVVVVSATNGKTTTAKMLAAMLEPERRLCRNTAGANLASGVASSLLACRERRSGRVRGRRGGARGRGAGAGAAGTRAREPVPRPARPLRRARGGRRPVAADLGRRRRGGSSETPTTRSWPRSRRRRRLAVVRHRRPGRRAAGAPPRRRLEMVRRAAATRLRYEAVYLGHLGRVDVPRAAGTPGPRSTSPPTSVDLRRPRRHRRSRSPLRSASAGCGMPLPGLYNVYNALAAVAMACALGDVAARADGGRASRRSAPAFGRFERVCGRRPRGRARPVEEPGRRERGHPHARARPGAQAARRGAERPHRRRPRRVVDLGRRLRAPRAAGVESVVTSGTRAAEMAVRLKYARLDPDAVPRRARPRGGARLGASRPAAGPSTCSRPTRRCSSCAGC